MSRKRNNRPRARRDPDAHDLGRKPEARYWRERLAEVERGFEDPDVIPRGSGLAQDATWKNHQRQELLESKASSSDIYGDPIPSDGTRRIPKRDSRGEQFGSRVIATTGSKVAEGVRELGGAPVSWVPEAPSDRSGGHTGVLSTSPSTRPNDFSLSPPTQRPASWKTPAERRRDAYTLDEYQRWATEIDEILKACSAELAQRRAKSAQEEAQKLEQHLKDRERPLGGIRLERTSKWIDKPSDGSLPFEILSSTVDYSGRETTDPQMKAFVRTLSKMAGIRQQDIEEPDALLEQWRKEIRRRQAEEEREIREEVNRIRSGGTCDECGEWGTLSRGRKMCSSCDKWHRRHLLLKRKDIDRWRRERQTRLNKIKYPVVHNR